jgi:hypothetical protein
LACLKSANSGFEAAKRPQVAHISILEIIATLSPTHELRRVRLSQGCPSPSGQFLLCSANIPLLTGAAMNGGKKSEVEVGEAHQPVWIEAVRVGVPLLWFIFAVVAFQRLLPLAQTVLKEGGINSIKVGIIELQLEHVSAKTGADPIEIAKEAVFISPDKRKQISGRFARMSEKTKGATLLWVDDHHPYQNVTERRVFLAANIYVDLAKSTSEAMEWLSRSKYDVIITDMERLGDQSAPCLIASGPSNAGCALLKKVGDCFKSGPTSEECPPIVAMQKNQLPPMIVYTARYPQELGVPYRARLTNRADELFGFVLDALEQRQFLPEN